MLDIHILALTGLTGLVIIALVIHLIFFVRLYEKVNRIDKSDSYLHLLVGRIETINESVHKKIDQMHRDLVDYGEKMVHVDRFLETLAKVQKTKRAFGSNPGDDLTLHSVATKEEK